MINSRYDRIGQQEKMITSRYDNIIQQNSQQPVQNDTEYIVSLLSLFGGVLLGAEILSRILDGKTLSYRYYILYYKKEIVYIGITDDLERRLREHIRNKMIFDSFDYSPLRSEERARKEEKRLTHEHEELHGELPKYNKKHGG